MTDADMEASPVAALPPKTQSRSSAVGRKLTLQEQLLQNASRLKPATDNKKKKAIKTENSGANPMASILEQIKLRKEALDQGGNIVKRPGGIEENSDEDESDDDDSFD